MPLVTLIDALPATITPEEHRERTATTPTAFSDIPPVLRYEEDNVRIVLEPPIGDLSEEELKRGRLYIIESVLAFVSSSTGRGFQIEYSCISLHAISRDGSNPCIYCQLDEPLKQERTDAEEDEETALRELRIVPESPASLDIMFNALSQCAALHPDPATDDDDMIFDDHDDVFVDVERAEGILEDFKPENDMTEAGRATMQRLESVIVDPHGHLARNNGPNGHAGGEVGVSDDEEHRFADAETS